MSRLTVAKVKGLQTPGRYADGSGLYLNIAKRGSKSWVLRITIDGRRRDMGLGGFPDVGLAQARRRAADNRAAVADGRNPIEEKRRASTPTFREAARMVHTIKAPTWRNKKHADSWMQTVERYALPVIGDSRIDNIGKQDVLRILTPIWTNKPETARRVRQRVRAIFDWAIAHDYIEYNPAGEAIKAALPAMPKVKEHLRSLPYKEVPAALKAISMTESATASKLCLRFAILTASRPGEARAAAWEDIDPVASLWVIPAQRMKALREHRVPLSDLALSLLEEAKSLSDGSSLVFPSPVNRGKPVSENTLGKVLKSAGLHSRTTAHGFRSSFRNWAQEQTGASHAAMELALAHAVGSAVERAYMRSDLLDQRRELMQQWANFLAEHQFKENCLNSDTC
ncbi:MAG: integrase arm-type DNA-binding domain-containing protein [Chloroflexi bacterium]|nr:integrase arm-type DNA-binding domain-containing protein [Chloroflexota bacterium]